ncbi:glycerophosphodiester phosphodiesterase family protein [Segetibacter sp. 3557_3]|uniref:glycerophosphodiester phosphodiesterase family protein n=1 Tax=Segetibacter sp. 3557_3 TaxID=2547429 RepID=UPI00105909F9|nr:glycerophosphodiester phosphodiesterase family protein [Segetibacter sp. 3557_3]TDH28654.1 glycerophosphodiester phosphodiesterase family protein [Segetibacter sp. 3557_3]
MKHLIKRAKRSLLLFAFSVLAYEGGIGQQHTINTLKINSSKELLDFFRYTGNDVPLVSGHRGGTTKGFPENCIPTFENTLRYTPAFFEIDPRLTKDSVIVLLHDATLDRTTNGKGKLADYTYEQLKQFRLKDPQGNVSEFKIPTLDEVIVWSKGKTIINLDKKDVPLEMTSAKLKQHKAEAHVMLTVHNAKEAKYYITNNPNVMFSAFVLTKAAFDEYEKEGIPWSHVMAYVGPTNKPENKLLYDLLHAKGVMCMISAAPSYDKLPDPQARKKAYADIIQQGANVVESDLPIEAGEAVQALTPKQSPKNKYFVTKKSS